MVTIGNTIIAFSSVNASHARSAITAIASVDIQCACHVNSKCISNNACSAVTAVISVIDASSTVAALQSESIISTIRTYQNIVPR
ncbi:unknown [Ruminococcus sp. CAG:382]|nr:unknown [Ruminococcus sp. CAG:382]